MYINELYDKLPLLSAETYTYISRDGDCHPNRFSQSIFWTSISTID